MGETSRKLSRISGVKEEDVKSVLGSLDTLILEDICKKGYCHIPGLGTFGIKEQKPHAICNISTGLLTQTKPSVALTFKSAATLRQGLNSFHLENE